MRAIWFILKLPLKILMAPVILSLTLFVWICVGIVYVSGLVLGLISMVVALLWSSVFVTLVAKKYRFMQFELDRVFDTR